MPVKEFRASLADSRLAQNDRKWFPRWLKRYTEVTPQRDEKLLLTTALVEKVLEGTGGEQDAGLAAVAGGAGAESYRDLVLKTDQPSLKYSTQDQAKSVPLFLYAKVLKRGWIAENLGEESSRLDVA